MACVAFRTKGTTFYVKDAADAFLQIENMIEASDITSGEKTSEEFSCIEQEDPIVVAGSSSAGTFSLGFYYQRDTDAPGQKEIRRKHEAGETMTIKVVMPTTSEEWVFDGVSESWSHPIPDGSAFIETFNFKRSGEIVKTDI